MCSVYVERFRRIRTRVWSYIGMKRSFTADTRRNDVVECVVPVRVLCAYCYFEYYSLRLRYYTLAQSSARQTGIPMFSERAAHTDPECTRAARGG